MKITHRNLVTLIREVLVKELRSPVGDSTAELLSDIDEVIEVLEGIKEISPMSVKIVLGGAINRLAGATSSDGRAISSVLSDVLSYVKAEPKIDAPGLILRLETLIRRSLPVPGNYDSPQSELKPPFDPSKAGRFNTIG